MDTSALERLRGGRTTTGGILLLAVVVVVILVSRRFMQYRHDPREPPVVPARIPYVGHIIGLIRYGGKYFQMIDENYKYPIYTLPLLHSRMYLVTSPVLASTIQRASKTLSFNKLVGYSLPGMIEYDEEAMKVCMNGTEKSDENPGLIPAMHDMLYSVLAPGKHLDEISELVLKGHAEYLNGLARRESQTIDLYRWTRDMFSVCTARALYGPENIFAMQPELVEAFWDLDAGMTKLMPGILPFIVARKAYYARKKLFAAFIEYIKQKRYLKASQVIRNRVEINAKHGLNTKMLGHGEVVFLWGSLVNATQSSFWLINNIFSRPELLKEIRAEIEAHAMTTQKEATMRVLDMRALRNSCPLLVSVYRETLRMTANVNSSRLVTADTMVADQYLLRANSVVQIVSGVIHSDPAVWGHDAAEFNPRRFYNSTAGNFTARDEAKQGSKQVNPVAFRAFSGGSVLCPGRHFAQVEILGLAAAMAMCFDVTAVDGGPMPVPGKDETGMLAVDRPLEAVHVNIRRRRGWEDATIAYDAHGPPA
ncbi:hypothetical protein H2199_006158 [Coniosporium tulheliwenetii]|uniref:Uncharacterized protein n=1 Tax=Coniosporium tulheliwenetii TaxID=3383036 RepID=A0ACC2YX67_9PEZI|nr:hypothetical protein H2199_006158 [Cladosporium sp. JES 115]